MLVVVAVLGCGSGQARTAREARYSASSDVVFKGVLRAVQTKYEVADADPQQRWLRTRERWFERDGTSEDRNADDAYIVRGGTIILAFEIAVKGAEGAYHVEVVPLVLEVLVGSPQPRRLAPDDPAMPGWVSGKIDNLYVMIYEQLKPHVVQMEAAP
jgi:hypothetical protein